MAITPSHCQLWWCQTHDDPVIHPMTGSDPHPPQCDAQLQPLPTPQGSDRRQDQLSDLDMSSLEQTQQ